MAEKRSLLAILPNDGLGLRIQPIDATN
jgi:hypothetical protein